MKEAKAALAYIHGAGMNILQQCKKYSAKSKEAREDSSSSDSNDVPSMLRVLSENAEESTLTDEEIYQNTLGFIVAGMDTTSSTLHFMASYLAIHPGNAQD